MIIIFVVVTQKLYACNEASGIYEPNFKISS